MEKYQIMGELNECISEFRDGKKTRKDVEAKIAYFETRYNFDGRDEYIKRLDRIEATGEEEETKDIGLDSVSLKILGVIGILLLVIVIVVSIFAGTEKTNLKEDATNTENKTIHEEKKWDSDDDALSDDFEEEIGTDPNEFTWNEELDYRIEQKKLEE